MVAEVNARNPRKWMFSKSPNPDGGEEEVPPAIFYDCSQKDSLCRCLCQSHTSGVSNVKGCYGSKLSDSFAARTCRIEDQEYIGFARLVTLNSHYKERMYMRRVVLQQCGGSGRSGTVLCCRQMWNDLCHDRVLTPDFHERCGPRLEPLGKPRHVMRGANCLVVHDSCFQAFDEWEIQELRTVLVVFLLLRLCAAIGKLREWLCDG
eukprot:2860918-Amphidinium_carterae.1